MASTASTVDIADGPILNKRDVHWKAYWSSEPTLFTSITHTSDTLWKTSKRACFHLLWTDYGIEPLEVAGAKIISEIRGTLTIWPHPHQLPHAHTQIIRGAWSTWYALSACSYNDNRTRKYTPDTSTKPRHYHFVAINYLFQPPTRLYTLYSTHIQTHPHNL